MALWRYDEALDGSVAARRPRRSRRARGTVPGTGTSARKGATMTDTGLPDLTWAVTDAKGAPVQTLVALAEAMGVAQKDAADALLGSQYVSCAPSGLVDECKAAAAPPSIANGSFVQLGQVRGRVDLVVPNGQVPGVADDDGAEGTPGAPAGRVVVYEEVGGKWKATSKKIGAKLARLKRIPPLVGARPGKKSVQDSLADLRAEAEALADGRGLLEQVRIPGTEQLLQVYERGVKAWPGSDTTELDPREWALGRARAFCTKALGEDVPGYTRDDDLLAAQPAEEVAADEVAEGDEEARRATEAAGGGSTAQQAGEDGQDPPGVPGATELNDPATEGQVMPDQDAEHREGDAEPRGDAGSQEQQQEGKGLQVNPADLAATLERLQA